MKNSLALVLKATQVSPSGFGTDTDVLRATKSVDAIDKSTVELLATETKSFAVGEGYRLTQFIVSGPQIEIEMDLEIERTVGVSETLTMKISGLTITSDSDVRSVMVRNTSTTDVTLNVIMAKARTA